MNLISGNAKLEAAASTGFHVEHTVRSYTAQEITIRLATPEHDVYVGGAGGL